MSFCLLSRFFRGLWVVLSLLCVSMVPARAAEGGWALAKVLADGDFGLSNIDDGQLGLDGTVLLRADGPDGAGLYLIKGGKVTKVVVVGSDVGVAGFPVSGVHPDYAIDDQGRVLFAATLSAGNDQRTHLFRWTAGTFERLAVESSLSVSHFPRFRSPDGRWLYARGSIEGQVVRKTFGYTDGTTEFPLVTVEPSLTSSSLVNTNFLPGGNGTLIGAEEVSKMTLDAFSSPIGGTDTTVIKQVGSVSRELARAVLTFAADEDGFLKASGQRINIVRSNRAGDRVLFFEETRADGRTTAAAWKVATASGISTVRDVAIDREIVDLKSIDGAGRVLAEVYDGEKTVLLDGASSLSNRIAGEGDSFDGGTLDDVRVIDAPETDASFGDRRLFLIEYTLTSFPPGKRGYLVASKTVTRWNDATGGLWSDAANWLPEGVPASTAEVLFDVDATYDVTVGAASVGRVLIEKGSVRLAQPQLNVTGPLYVGGPARFTQSDGAITAGEITFGSLPPLDPSAPPLTSVFLSNAGTSLKTAGPLVVGGGGRADVLVSDATLESAASSIGVGARGDMVVTGSKATWKTGALSIGDRVAASLTIENQAAVESTSAIIGRGDGASNGVAQVLVDNGNLAAPKSVGNWYVSGDLQVGGELGGRLILKNGGSVGIGGALKSASVHGVGAYETVISLDGTGTTADVPTYLYILGDAEFATGTNAFTHIEATNGGMIHTAKKVSLAAGSGSLAEVLIGGVNAKGQRTQWGAGADVVRVGDQGEGLLFITEGGLAEIPNMFVGGQAGSKGEVYVVGAKQGVAGSTLRCFLLVVGGNSSVGTSDSAPGLLTVQGFGAVEVSGTFVLSRLGRLQGDSTVLAASMLIEGTVAPGAVALEVPDLFGSEPNAISRYSSAMSLGGGDAAPLRKTDNKSPLLSPEKLTLKGNVELKPTARIEVSVGGTNGETGTRLEVQGALSVGGTVVVSFKDGYAPRAGEKLNLITATSATGAFTGVEIQGLAPGFQSTLSLDPAGSATLTALNDAVPQTLPTFLTQPVSVQARAGALVQLSVETTGTGVAYQWRRNGITLPSASTATLTLPTVAVADAGQYDVVVTNAAGSVTSQTATVEVTPAAGRLVNMSVRTQLAKDQNLIVGFVVSGGSKACLLRALGPGLDALVSGGHRDPSLTVFDSSRSQLARNDSWPSDLAAVMARVGATPLQTGSTDAAWLGSFEGIRTAHINGPGAGLVLVELYDTETSSTARLANVSARGKVGIKDDILIAGFVIEGDAPLKVLIRGVGPGLQRFDVSGVLAAPVLTLYDRNGRELASNDNWSSADVAIHNKVGAAELTPGSEDSALIVTLAPGIYTAHLRGRNDGTGEGLIEVYEVVE